MVPRQFNWIETPISPQIQQSSVKIPPLTSRLSQMNIESLRLSPYSVELTKNALKSTKLTQNAPVPLSTQPNWLRIPPFTSRFNSNRLKTLPNPWLRQHFCRISNKQRTNRALINHHISVKCLRVSLSWNAAAVIYSNNRIAVTQSETRRRKSVDDLFVVHSTSPAELQNQFCCRFSEPDSLDFFFRQGRIVLRFFSCCVRCGKI